MPNYSYKMMIKFVQSGYNSSVLETEDLTFLNKG